ncbi:MAG: hypothetical protein QOG52_1937 [Frankiaceae bacterium]|nr:hypothetical protein [Frankiaceae bacterium]
MVEEPGYEVAESGQGLEQVWGPGFMSPGGPAEVARILGDADLTGLTVLDVGCGIGGPGMALVVNHGARRVVGVDVQPTLLDLARARALAAGLADRLSYEVLEPGGPLPFDDDTFDVVFSKDALIHVAEKATMFSEMLRVVRPGGRLLVSDWLRGQGAGLDQPVETFVLAAGHAFTMISLTQLEQFVREAGFENVEVQDRRDWYLEEARAERQQMPAEEREFWDVLVASLEVGALRPGHVRARKAAVNSP